MHGFSLTCADDEAVLGLKNLVIIYQKNLCGVPCICIIGIVAQFFRDTYSCAPCLRGALAHIVLESLQMQSKGCMQLLEDDVGQCTFHRTGCGVPLLST